MDKPFNTVAIIGKPGTGKSSIGLLMSSLINRYLLYSTVGEALDLENLKALKKALEFVQRRVVLFLDDFSFAISGRSQKDRLRLKNLMEIRHILGENHRYYVILVGHYVRSLSPILRSANIKMLTSVDVAEVRLYAQEYMFSESSLLTYFEYLQQKPNEFLVLVNFGTSEEIMNLTMPYIGYLIRKYKIEEFGPWKLYKFAASKRKLLNINLLNIFLSEKDESSNN